MSPYSHEVLLSLVAAPNAEFVKAMQLQQPKRLSKIFSITNNGDRI